MKEIKKRVLSILLAMVTVIGCFPASVYANELESVVPTESETIAPVEEVLPEEPVVTGTGDAPVAVNMTAEMYDESKVFDLAWDATEVGSGDGVYVIEVMRNAAPGMEGIYEVVDTISYAQTYYTYQAKRTGYYTFRVHGMRDDINTEYAYSAADQYMFVPLEEPKVILRQASEKMSLTWTGDAERVVSYDLAYRKADPSEKFIDPESEEYKTLDEYTYTSVFAGQADTSYTFTGLELNSYYYFQITAHADDGEVAHGYAGGYFIKDDFQSKTGSSFIASVGIGTGTGSNKPSGSWGNTVSISTTNEKFADSEDGISFFYIPVTKDQNFILTATFTLKDASKADNQAATGIIAVDTLGSKDKNAKYFNSFTSGACKLIPPTTGGQAIYRVPGVRYVTGYIDPTANLPYDPADTSDTPAGLRKMVNKFVFTSDKDTGFVTGSTYTFTLRKSNTGYEGSMSGSDKTFFLYGDDALMVQEDGKIYVGFFAAREISVSVTDMVMTYIDPATDEPKVDPPVVYLDKSVNIYSPSHAYNNDYTYEIRPTFAGTLTLTDDEGNTIVSSQHIDAKEYYKKAITLTKQTTTFTATFTPDVSQPLEDYSDVVLDKTVSVASYGVPGQTIVVSPSGTPLGTGSEEKPLDIYTATAYAQPGQTILLKKGTYNLQSKLTLERGHNGTADAPIRIVGECVDNIVADVDAGDNTAEGVKFNLAGLDMTTGTAFEIAGDYWYVYGIEIYNTPHDVKTIQVSGNHNTVEMVLLHDVGNSGIQISGSSKETIEHWPSYNTILNCEVYNCMDAKMNDADGFAAKLTSGYGNIFEGCISHHNIDDGWDLYAKSTTGVIGPVIIRNCVTYANGRLTTYATDGLVGEGNGFKMGGESMPVNHQLINSITYDNGAKGVTSNSDPNGTIEQVICYNNAFISKSENFSLYTNSARNTAYTVNNLVSMTTNSSKQDKRALVKDGVVTSKSTELDSPINFFWSGKKSINSNSVEAKAATWFKNTNTTILPTRNADGTINMHGLLEPSSTMLGYVSFDYEGLQGTTGNITNIATEVTTLLGNAITEDHGAPVKVEIIKAPATTLEGASVDLTDCKVRITYTDGAVLDQIMTKAMLNKSIFYYEDGATQTVTVTVANGVSTTFEITVLQKKATSLSWSVKPSTTVSLNGTLNVTGAQILVNYSNATFSYVDVTSEMVTLDASKLGAAVATITYQGMTLTLDVNIVESSNPITGLTLDKTTANVSVGGTVTIKATVSPSDTTDSSVVSWKSADTAIATVANGVVTGVVAGSTTITASITSSTLGTIEKTCTVTVSASGSSGGGTGSGTYVYNFTESTPTLGDTSGFYVFTGKASIKTSRPAVTYAGMSLTKALQMETDTVITFNAPSDGKLYVVFDSTGKLNFKIDGTKVTTAAEYVTDISAGTHKLTKADQAYIYYIEYVPNGSTVTTYSASLNKTGLSNADAVLSKTSDITASDTVTVTITPNSGYEFKTKPTVIATGATAGTVTAGADGSYTCPVSTFTTNATISVAGTATQKQFVPANVDVIGVALDITSKVLNVNDTVQLTAMVLPNNATNKNVSWSSSNESVASVDTNGLVTAVSSGSATITVTTQDGGLTANCSIVVTSNNPSDIPVTGVGLDQYSLDMKIGDTATLEAIVLPLNASNQNVTWSSDNTSVATVKDGVVTAVGNGTATIKVVTEDGKKEASCAVTVSEDIELIKFVKRMYTVALNRTEDPDGLDYWTGELKSGNKTGAELCSFFLLSQELTDKNLSNTEFVNLCYATLFDRAADQGGFDHWMELLDGGMSRKYIIAGFCRAPEFDMLCQKFGIKTGSVVLTAYAEQNENITMFITRGYTKTLGRKAEEAGVEYWAEQLITGKTTARDIAKFFVYSDEFVSKNLNDSAYIDVLYATFFGRDSKDDVSGKTYWMTQLNNGTMNRDNVFEFFAGSEEFTEILASFGLN